MNQQRKSRIEDAQFKIIMVGNSGVGKSSLLGRYIKGVFSGDYQATVGVEFASKIVKIDQNFNVKLTIWDTAGQESFKSIIKNYYRNSSALFLVYDITDSKSFQALQDWLAQARDNAPQNVMLVLVGTHSDMPTSRNVYKEQAQEWMKKNHVELFFETSAKSAQNVTLAFEQVAKQLFLQRMNRSKSMLSSANQIRSNVELINQKKQQGCCK